MSDGAPKPIEFDKVFAAGDISIDEFKDWCNHGKDYECAHRNDDTYSLGEGVLKPIVGPRTEVDDAIATMKGCDVTFCIKHAVPWFAVVRKGMLLFNVIQGLGTTAKREALMKLCDHFDLSWTNNKNSRLNDIMYVTEFFKKYPVLLLQWGADLRKTYKPVSFIVKHKKQLEAFLNKDPIVKDFYKGM